MRLSITMRVMVWSMLTILWVTGTIWLTLVWSSPPIELDQHVAAWESFLMRVHGGGAMLALLILGALVPLHVLPSWRRGRNRISGMSICALMIVLIVTAFGIYYAGDDQWRAVLSGTHKVVGLASPMLLAGHIWLGRRTRSASPAVT